MRIFLCLTLTPHMLVCRIIVLYFIKTFFRDLNLKDIFYLFLFKEKQLFWEINVLHIV